MTEGSKNLRPQEEKLCHKTYGTDKKIILCLLFINNGNNNLYNASVYIYNYFKYAIEKEDQLRYIVLGGYWLWFWTWVACWNDERSVCWKGPNSVLCSRAICLLTVLLRVNVREQNGHGTRIPWWRCLIWARRFVSYPYKRSQNGHCSFLPEIRNIPSHYVKGGCIQWQTYKFLRDGSTRAFLVYGIISS